VGVIINLRCQKVYFKGFYDRINYENTFICVKIIMKVHSFNKIHTKINFFLYKAMIR